MIRVLIRTLTILSCLLLLVAGCLLVFFMYQPASKTPGKTITYTVNRGMASGAIAKELEEQGIVSRALFFKAYIIISGNHAKLQAGTYDLSSSMSPAQIAQKMGSGDVIKETVTIIEGWNTREIAQYLEGRKLFSIGDFLGATLENWSHEFSFLKERPISAGAGLEGYLFPDTYEISSQDSKELNSKELVKRMLSNFDKKLNQNLRQEIAQQKKSIFEIVTMASIIEKEVKSTEDKKVVSGILWKRLDSDIPLQVDSTINYITGKSDAKVATKDTKINSPYNTYKYLGLPKGPISNPGLDSIMAAIYPTKSPYLYYLSADGDGKTIFSKTLEEHNIAKSKYLK